MSTTIPIPQFTVTPTPRTFGPQPVPVGTQHLMLVLDGVNLLAGNTIWLKIEWDTTGSGQFPFMALCDCQGPGSRIDKHVGPTSLLDLSVDLGVPAGDGWQIRATVWSVVDNVVIPSGSLTLS